MKLNVILVEKHRKKLGLQKKEMADLLGISAPYYTLLIKGDRRPTINIVEDLYFKVGLSLKQILIP